MIEKNKQVGKYLLQIHRTGEPEFVEALYDAVAPTIRHIGLKYLHKPYLADDFVQDFWADIYHIAGGYTFCFNGFAYLCKVATNRAINKYKQLTTEAHYVTYVDYSQFQVADESLRYEQIELRIAVETAMKKLSEKERIIIQSTFFEQKTVRQIAVELKTSKSTVDRLKSQALVKLKKALE